MDRENCKSATEFSIPQSQNAFVIQNATPFIHFGLNMHATGHTKLTITILDVMQPLNFPVFNRVLPHGRPRRASCGHIWFFGA